MGEHNRLKLFKTGLKSHKPYDKQQWEISYRWNFTRCNVVDSNMAEQSKNASSSSCAFLPQFSRVFMLYLPTASPQGFTQFAYWRMCL